jgi:hypothetical protein
VSTNEHPSHLMLDRYALDGNVSEDVRRHVTECPTCQANVEAVQRPLPVPTWAREVATKRPLAARKLFGWIAGAAGLSAAATVALLVMRPAHRVEETSYDTTRGAPSVGLYVKRGTNVSLWDGQSPMQPGDRLRLKVVPEGLTHVTVFSPAPASTGPAPTLKVLYAARVEPHRENLLPRTWEVDHAGGRESLLVVLSRSPISVDQANSLGSHANVQSGVWVWRLTMSKRLPADASETGQRIEGGR